MAMDVEGLRGKLAGEVILPGDEGYEAGRRIWNAMVDRRPAVIAKCANLKSPTAKREAPARTVAFGGRTPCRKNVSS